MVEKKPPTLKKPRIASVEDALILAAVRGYYHYDHEWQAEETLAKIHNDYLRSKESTPEKVKLWVRGFNITKDEKAMHYRGNFALLAKVEAAGGKWSIRAEKIDVPLAKHPEKERPKERHPNWGHPVLRAVETGKLFDGLEIARAFLHSLHAEYPDATIPGKDVVHVMVYRRKDDEASPIEKISLKVKPQSDGGAKLVVMKKKPKAKPLPNQTPPAELETKGKFTTLIKKSRARKK